MVVLLAKFWRVFCGLVARVFYRHFEVSGESVLSSDHGVILCANHVNALADAVVIQASTKRMIRPLARSGLFKNPLLAPFLAMMGAIPVYRRKDPGVDVSKNKDSFERVYELLQQNEVIIIFPEGQSHSDPHLHELKTGAARMALGTLDENGVAPLVIPVGLNFSNKGKFRSNVLVHYGEPVDSTFSDSTTDSLKVRKLTHRISEGLARVTLNAESWDDIDLMKRIEHFFSFRGGKKHEGTLTQQFRALHRLLDTHKRLRTHEKERIRSIVIQLKTFERLCKQCGIEDYNLSINYRPAIVFLYIVRSLLVMLVVVPVALWAWVNSIIPYLLTRRIARLISEGRDQYDTAKMAVGIVLFALFWGLQIYYVSTNFGAYWAVAYLVSLIVSTTVALKNRGEYGRIKENIQVFFLFMRKRNLREYLLEKRQQLESELATLIRISKRLDNGR